MRIQHLLAVSAVLSVAGLTGCGSKSSPDAAQATPTSNTQAVPGVRVAGPKPKCMLPADAPPDVVVRTFFQAMQTGDDEQIAALLTQRAWEETQQSDYQIRAQGIPTAQFTVGKVELFLNDETKKEDHARVHSVLTSADENGEASQDIFWLLRQQGDGWRVFGMASPSFEGDRLAFVNFESREHISSLLSDAPAGTQPAEGTATVENTAPDAGQDPAVREARNPGETPPQ